MNYGTIRLEKCDDVDETYCELVLAYRLGLTIRDASFNLAVLKALRNCAFTKQVPPSLQVVTLARAVAQFAFKKTGKPCLLQKVLGAMYIQSMPYKMRKRRLRCPPFCVRDRAELPIGSMERGKGRVSV